jgi:transposase
MKTKKESNTTAVRNKYTAQFKEQALERADKDGIPTVAQDLRGAESMLYSWRAKLTTTRTSSMCEVAQTDLNYLCSLKTQRR